MDFPVNEFTIAAGSNLYVDMDALKGKGVPVSALFKGDVDGSPIFHAVNPVMNGTSMYCRIVSEDPSNSTKVLKGSVLRVFYVPV